LTNINILLVGELNPQPFSPSPFQLLAPSQPYNYYMIWKDLHHYIIQSFQ